MPTIVTSAPPGIAHEDHEGLRVVNESDRVLFQRRCSWVRTCAGCAQYHGRLHTGSADVPGTPMHVNCGCMDIPIRPGESSKGYVEWQQVVPHLAEDQRKRLMGVGNFRLLESGHATVSDIVGRRTVRPFGVVASEVQTPRSLVSVPDVARWFSRNAGLSPSLATRAAKARLAYLRVAGEAAESFAEVAASAAISADEAAILLGPRLATKLTGVRLTLEMLDQIANGEIPKELR